MRVFDKRSIMIFTPILSIDACGNRKLRIKARSSHVPKYEALLRNIIMSPDSCRQLAALKNMPWFTDFVGFFDRNTAPPIDLVVATSSEKDVSIRSDQALAKVQRKSASGNPAQTIHGTDMQTRAGTRTAPVSGLQGKPGGHGALNTIEYEKGIREIMDICQRDNEGVRTLFFNFSSEGHRSPSQSLRPVHRFLVRRPI